MGNSGGISFIQVSVTELEFKLNKKFKLPKDGIPVDLLLDVKHSFSRDKKTLSIVLSALLFNKTKNPPFKMNVSVEGTFIGENAKDLQKFSKIHATAHLMPFIRETVGNTTMKANIPPLLLPPFNLAEQFKTRKK